ncbi:Uncharacterized protein SAMN05216319_1296 [Duganella sp. CF402]|uniref:WD40/YVTN/BNR-like repeat-containing protein n=1 Tax=unclassified Duganella TaxID=2636909 RepID=UPI0008C2C067|nr:MULTISPECIES: YCF48-related protein [unclassified Duganella]RZT10247.1 photosystem II stability/assembly factor-like uncharacterized protein [Duganella sp. BK701]SEL21963.1 Uncharacterized protein SAMN05216319_1296 [Duganella sp. CF402]
MSQSKNFSRLSASLLYTALAAALLPAATNAAASGAAAAAATGGAVTVAPASGAVVAAQLRPAVMSRQAAQSVMLGAVRAGSRIVAVGERGIILFSDDNGQRWQQADAPVSVTLTAVRFADARNGVAVGHAGVVLTTADGGAHWQRVLDGQHLAALALQAAKAAAGFGPAAGAGPRKATATRAGADTAAGAGASAATSASALRDAERLVADGADKPLLDVCLLGTNRILAVGAYGLAFASEDGGRTWTPWMNRIDNPKGLHLNTVRASGDTILIAGERGYAQLSTDAGRSFKPLNVPYNGSFFTAELSGEKEILLAGLRGNAWRSADAGKSWQQIASPAPVTITASTTRSDGTQILANQAGMLLAVRDQALVPISAKPLPPLNAVLDLNNGGLLTLSIQGIVPVAGDKQ